MKPIHSFVRDLLRSPGWLGIGLAACLAWPLKAEPPEARQGIPIDFPKKKLIAVGWDAPEPATLLENLGQIEKTPFDGIALQMEVDSETGEKILFRRAFNGTPWKREWFEGELEILKKARSKKLTDNFLLMGPGRALDWFDDAGWREVVEHFRIAAWIAKEAGLKGIMFDPELGSSQQPPFSYSRQINKQNHSFEEYTAKVRERGREMMEAMAAEYPDMTIFALFLNCGQAYSPILRQGGIGDRQYHFYVNGDEVRSAGPTNPAEVQEQGAPLESIEGGPYNMLPALLNGWLDSAPPGITFVDGVEGTYVKTAKEDFLFWANLVRNTSLALVAKENRSKYRAQVQVGFGIYLDAYVNPSSSRHYVGPEESYQGPAEGPANIAARMNRLEKAVSTAAGISDEYVWLWGEKYRWWPTRFSLVNPQTWDEVAPGMSNSLRYAMDPAPRTRQRLLDARAKFAKAQNEQQSVNLLRNGNFEDLSDGAWKAWRKEESDGGKMDAVPDTGREGSGSARLSGVSDGAFVQEIAAGGGNSIYAIRAWVRQTGGGEAKIRIRWRISGRKGERWLTTHSDNIYLSPGEGEQNNEWKEIFGVVAAPPGVEKLVIHLGAAGQSSAEESIFYDDVGVYKIQ